MTTDNKFKQPKQLKITKLKQSDEFHPCGHIFTIIDNDGTTILKEFWDINEKIGIQYCRNWLKIKSGEELDFSEYNKKEVIEDTNIKEEINAK
jgi:hypothetical protein